MDFAPFLLRPDIPPGGGPARRIVAAEAPPTPMEQRGEGMGLRFNRGRTETSYSHVALEAAEFATEHGDPWRFHKAMFKAYFEDLKDIGNIETVIGVGEEAGLDVGSLRAALEEGRYRERVDEGIAWSRSIGVTAIPTFVFNERYGMVGAQEQEAFRTMMEKLGQAPRT